MEKVVGKGRIKVGAYISHDGWLTNWPNCFPPKEEYNSERYKETAKNPDIIFFVEWNYDKWICKADGYGNDNYGRGPICVKNFNDVELVTEPISDKTDNLELLKHFAGLSLNAVIQEKYKVNQSYYPKDKRNKDIAEESFLIAKAMVDEFKKYGATHV